MSDNETTLEQVIVRQHKSLDNSLKVMDVTLKMISDLSADNARLRALIAAAHHEAAAGQWSRVAERLSAEVNKNDMA